MKRPSSAASDGVQVTCPGADPRIERLKQGVKVGQARTDDADIEFKPGPDQITKIHCTNGMLEVIARRNQMTLF